MIVNYFGATWCGHCKMAKPYVKSKETELALDGHEVIFWDADDNETEDIMERYGVKALPTMVFIKDGEEFFRMNGWSKGESEKVFDNATSGDVVKM